MTRRRTLRRLFHFSQYWEQTSLTRALCTTKQGNNAAVCKACESKTSEDAESVERQCAHKERGCDMEAHAFLDTIAMSSFACHKVANRILKVRVDGSGCHQPAMFFQRMG